MKEIKMNPLIPYLFFNGNCREVMNFYQSCFGGELEFFTYADSPENNPHKGANDEIMHATLRKDALTIMAADWPDKDAKQGNNVHFNIDSKTIAEIETLFKALSQDGKIVQPLVDTFWGARFGMLVDKFGIHWMLNCSLNK
jgi:PhnB protein